ncbi:hypothetical protein [Rhizobacter sp. Root1221]|nr:hypothetical protein [Rhizobacter sp. Root1221]
MTMVLPNSQVVMDDGTWRLKLLAGVAAAVLGVALLIAFGATAC